MFKKGRKEEETREELKMWNIIQHCFETGEIDETPFRLENYEEGGLDIYHIADRMDLNFNETIKILNRLKAHGLIKYMVSPSYVFMKKGVL